MKLPLPSLLYLTALGLLGWVGWVVYESLPLWRQETRSKATSDYSRIASEGINKGAGERRRTSDWDYSEANWWQQFKLANLTGKLPPKPKTPEEIAEESQPKAPPVDMTPLEDIFELVSLVCNTDGKAAGSDAIGTHVIIRYKPTANVNPPEWWLRQNMPSDGVASGRDVVGGPAIAASTQGRAGRPRPNGPPATRAGMPVMSGGTGSSSPYVQILWLDGGDDEERGNRLWPAYEHIRLVGVSPDAQFATFERELPAPAEGEPAPEPHREKLFKTQFDIPQELLQEFAKLRGQPLDTERVARTTPQASSSWRDVATTTRYGNEIHIGREDEKRFRRTGGDDFFNSVYVDTYKGRSTSGLRVRNVEPKLAQAYGVQTGEVLLAINGRDVTSKAQAMNMVKKDYNRGVRTFSTTWLSNGQEITRVYQAPDK